MLPCKGILANKHIGNTSGCPVCQRGCEDIKHMMFTCERARNVWTALGVWGQIEEILSADRSGSVIIEEAIRRGGRVEALDNVGFPELLVTAGWYIWWERRQLCHGEKIQRPHRSALSIAALTCNYKLSGKKSEQRKQG